VGARNAILVSLVVWSVVVISLRQKSTAPSWGWKSANLSFDPACGGAGAGGSQALSQPVRADDPRDQQAEFFSFYEIMSAARPEGTFLRRGESLFI
jgi:hypothetical protein